MSYSLNKFLSPLKSTDKTVRIFDDRNYPVHTINPFSVLRVYVTNLNLNIALSGNRIITLDFISLDETKEALFKLQSFIDQLRQKSPDVVDKETEKYVERIIQTSVGVKSINGVTASEQFIVTNSDDNLEINFDTTGQTHSISLNWSGILPIERGGLNNTEFQQNELLISSGEKVESSGFKVNDDGVSDKDIWSADKIINKISSGKAIFNIGDGISNNFLLPHNFGTRNVIVQIFDTETGDSVETFVRRKDENSVEVHFNQPPSEEEYCVIIS